MNCTLCSASLYKKADDLYFICQNCGAYVKDKDLYFDETKEKHHYEQHQNDIHDIGYQKFTAPVTETILNLCTTDMLGLDYGCGKGPVITEKLKEKGFLVDLYDPYFYPDTAYENKTYDFIFSCEVFEHFYHPFDEITKLRKLLNPGGLLIIKTHLFDQQTEFQNWYYRKDLTHVFIYTFKTVEFIAEHFLFDSIALSEKLIVLRKK